MKYSKPPSLFDLMNNYFFSFTETKTSQKILHRWQSSSGWLRTGLPAKNVVLTVISANENRQFSRETSKTWLDFGHWFKFEPRWSLHQGLRAVYRPHTLRRRVEAEDARAKGETYMYIVQPKWNFYFHCFRSID